MTTPPDFIEREVNKILDLIEKACTAFGVEDEPPVKEETKRHEFKKDNG